jgi:hypothetical protein
MSRTITILGLVQTLLIVIGFFGLGIVMKINGYPHDGFGVSWSPIALFLRREGLCLLLIPAVWTIFATTSQNRQKLVFSTDGWCVFGIILSVLIVGVFLYANIFPYTRPIFIAH